MNSNNYKIVGKGKKNLVFIHYFGGDAGSWNLLAKKLAKKYTCILLNLPGFGNNPLMDEPSLFYYATFINNQIQQLALKEYSLVGHSMGGKIALYAALMNEDLKPEKIILVAPSPPTVENMSENEKKRMLNHPNKREAEITLQNGITRRLRSKIFDYAVYSQLKIASNAWEWWINTGKNHDISESVKNLDVPTFVICSKNDPVISMEAIYNEVMPYLKMGTLIALTRVGHLIPLEAPRKLARHIKRIGKIKYENRKD